MGSNRVQDTFGLAGASLDNYDVERVVAAGGFGIVYFARHRAIGQEAAIKVLKLSEDLAGEAREDFMQKFLEEARTIAALKHPAIVTVLDFKVSEMPVGGKTPWMALEWIEGETLSQQLLARRGRGGRDPRTCLGVLEPVFDALSLAHSRGIAHRDVKPANIMLPARGAIGRFGVAARLLDFGIAKEVGLEEHPGTDVTETTSPYQAYSLPYAASEQVSGMRSGPRTDVHALALVLVEMLTDQPPFSAENRGALMMKVMSPTRPTPSRFGVNVGAWEHVLARALSLVPSERYANAGELLAALERHLPAEVSRAPVTDSPAAAEAPHALAPALAATATPRVAVPMRVAPTRAPTSPRRALAIGAAVFVVAAGVVFVARALRPSNTPPSDRLSLPSSTMAVVAHAPERAPRREVAADASVAAPTLVSAPVVSDDEGDVAPRPRARRHRRHLPVTLR